MWSHAAYYDMLAHNNFKSSSIVKCITETKLHIAKRKKIKCTVMQIQLFEIVHTEYEYLPN